ncbi:14291_t:CDS:2 [Entrophospora sp. SA101]|nr:14291_t:CDS:2 [Entrophospora sp. SA101]
MSTSITKLLIPYGKYFEFFPPKVWSLQHFSAMIAEYYESTNKRTIHNVFYKTLKGIENDQNFTEEVHQIAKELIKKKKSDTKEVSKVLEDITNSSEKRKIVTMGMDSSSTSKKKKITEQSELITLEDALSYIPPHVTYSPHGTISKNTTQVGGKPPKKVLLWKDFFNMVNEHYFDNKQPRFKEPQFIGKFKVTNEEIVRQAINVNIFMVLNELTPNYEYSMRKVLGDGNPDYACYYLENTLILVIEIKRAHVLSELNSGQSLPDFYETNSRAKDVVQQIYYYMSENQLQYGILSTYDNHWFVRRDHQHLYITETLILGSISPTVLKAYAFLAQFAKDNSFSLHPNII